MNPWTHFKQQVGANLLTQYDQEVKGVSYWRNQLFARIIVYLLPVGLVAWVPGVIMSIKGGIPLLAVYDTAAVICFAIIAFNRRFSLLLRKILLTLCLYALSLFLLIFLGSFGPGLLYLLALTTFVTLIFPIRIAVWSIGMNALVCVLFAVIIHLQWLDSPLIRLYTLGSWIAVSSNLVFLSVVMVASLHLLFTGLQTTIEKEAELQHQLKQESQMLARMLESVETKNRELEQFAYISSHDLQEPLQTISSLVDLLVKRYQEKLDEDAKVYFTFLSQSSNRMRSLNTGLLDYLLIGQQSTLMLVNSQEIVAAALNELDASIQATQAEMKVDALPTVWAYPNELKHLFTVLLTNSIKFTTTGLAPVVTISAQQEEDYWLFSVSDNGIGVDAKFYEKIFVIFQRLHPRSSYSGIGVGLAQARKIAELHNGKIWIDSLLGQGSTFHFTISRHLHQHPWKQD